MFTTSTQSPSKKPSRMVQGILATLVVCAVVFLAFQAGVYSTRPKDHPVWGSTEAGIVASNNWFGLSLYTGLRRHNKDNLFFSPFSISSALTMTSLGAKEKTKEQMIEVLHFDKYLTHEVLHGGFKTLLQQLISKEKDHYILHLANKVYLQEGFKVLDSFKKDTSDYYSAESQNLDFKADTEKSRKIVNSWVQDITKEKVKELLKPGVLSDLTRFILVNAIYFKGNWQKPFDPKLTSEQTFYVNNQDTAKVDLMFQKGHFRNGFDQDLDAHILELPYAGNDLSMLIVLPAKKTGLIDVEDKLTGDVASLSKNLRNTSIDVYLPKFNMTSQFDLKDLLKLMGMTDLFSEGTADLSGMNGRRDLSVSHVIHQAFIEVNEEGTEAAAATAVIGLTRAAMRPNIFRADHPFYFYIRHEQTNPILFMGRFMHPTAGKPVTSTKEDL